MSDEWRGGTANPPLKAVVSRLFRRPGLMGWRSIGAKGAATMVDSPSISTAISRRSVVLGRPGDNNDAREWPFVAHLRALGRQPEAARREWERTPKAKGLAAARAGRLVEAIRLLEQARTDLPWRDDEIDANLAEIRVIRRLEKKLELRPNDAMTLLALGKAYFAQERGEAALMCFQRAAKASPALAEAHAMIGLELHFRGDTAGAEAAYGEALRIQPRHSMAGQYLRDLRRGEPPGGSAEAEGAVPIRTISAAG